MSNIQDWPVHDWLSSKGAGLLSWVSAALGFGTVLGFVNLAVGVLSALWLTAQLWNYFTYTLPRNRREVASWEAEVAAAETGMDLFSSTDEVK